MSTEARKTEIRRRVALMRYRRRSKAQFTDKNDHNPLVLQDCPKCHGSGHVGESWNGGGVAMEADVICDACNGSGISGGVERYFPEDRPEVEAIADSTGWLTCPHCRWRFAIRDKRAWTGRRHLRCGQKIQILRNY